jgi:hypothetical protein
MSMQIGYSWRSSGKIVGFMNEIYRLLTKVDQIRRVVDNSFAGPELQQVGHQAE